MVDDDHFTEGLSSAGRDMNKGKGKAKAGKRKATAKATSRKRVAPKKGDASLALAKQIARIASDRKAEEIVVLDLRGLSSFTDSFVICSGLSDRQVLSIAESVRDEMKRAGRLPLSEEGVRSGHWALLDYGEVVLHVFYHADRAHYQLERLWYDAPRVALRGITF